jgi:hypothetical protein
MAGLFLLFATPPSAWAGVAFFARQTDTIQVSGQTIFGTASTYEARILFPSALFSGGAVFNEWQGFAEDKYLAVVPGQAGSIQGFNYALSGSVFVASADIALDQ